MKKKKSKNFKKQLIDKQNELLIKYINSKKCKVEDLETLISKGANVNSEDSSKNTPLWIAADSGKLGIVKYLISKGSNVNHQITKDSILSKLIKKGCDSEMIEVFVSNGA